MSKFHDVMKWLFEIQSIYYTLAKHLQKFTFDFHMQLIKKMPLINWEVHQIFMLKLTKSMDIYSRA